MKSGVGDVYSRKSKNPEQKSRKLRMKLDSMFQKGTP
jgi:hypothetical protein